MAAIVPESIAVPRGRSILGACITEAARNELTGSAVWLPNDYFTGKMGLRNAKRSNVANAA